MFYDFAPTYTKWELDSYFDLTDEQEEWVEVRLEQHFNWHREVELEHYITFLREVQRRGGDGLTLQEIKEGNERINDFFFKITDRLMDDTTGFLYNLEPRQLIFLEEKLADSNREREESRSESREERIKERFEEFMESMEEWFGDFNEQQVSQLKDMHQGWNEKRTDPSQDWDHRRKLRQQAFLNFLKSNPTQNEIRSWLTHWYRNWSIPGDLEAERRRKVRIERNMQRILQVDSILTEVQRKHAVDQIEIWIKRFQAAIPKTRV
ncbi:MAG: DUF6279 family lipoprotein [SAR324 cluster bacterium]|nr:DUF6279 family lipoprotein [SAR324 cluster bacterium]